MTKKTRKEHKKPKIGSLHIKPKWQHLLLLLLPFIKKTLLSYTKLNLICIKST